MKEKDFVRWAETRGKGRRKYILQNGVLSWGLPMFVIMTFVVNDAFDESGLNIFRVAINLIIWSFGGLLFGALSWHFLERNYQKELINRKGE